MTQSSRAVPETGVVEELRAWLREPDYAERFRLLAWMNKRPVAKFYRLFDALEAKDRELAEARANLSASRKLVERREAERDREKERADGNWDAYRDMIRERDEALAALREREERVKALEECVKSGLRAERASYLQALAEQQGHDAIAGRHDKTVTEWRAHARSVLSSVQPVSGSREQRGNEEG